MTWVVILVVAALILASLGLYAWRRRTTPGALSFSLLMFAIATWSLAYALELLGQGLSTKMLWIKVEYVGIAAMPVLWLAFSLQYTGRGWWLSRRNVVLLAIMPVITVLLVWTNELHHLHYRLNVVDWSSGWPLLHIEYGPWFWANALFSYLFMLLGTLLLGEAFLRSSSLHRGQTGVLLLGALIPWLGNAVYLTGLVPWPDLDPTPLAFALSGLVLAYGLFRYKLLQVVPVAQQAVIEGMPTAMIVLDSEGRIADLNPAARGLFGLTDREAIGQLARQVLGPAEVVEHFADVAQTDTEMEWGEDDDRRVYRVTISPLDDQSAQVPARLVLISDVTEQVKAKEAMERTNQQLLALQESTAALTALLDPADLFERVMDQLERLMPYQYATLGLYDEPAERLTFVASRGFGREELVEAEHSALTVGDNAIFQQMVETNAPVIIADVSQDPRWAWVDGLEFARAWIGAPLQVKGQTIGQLSVYHPQPGYYRDEDGQTLQILAQQVAVAIENARLHEETRHWADRLHVMHEVATAAATATSLDETLQRTVRAVQQTTGADNVALLLLEPDRGDLVIRAWVGFPEGPALVRRQVGVGVPGWVVQTGQPALIPDVGQDPRYHACDEDARSELCVPLQVGREVIGALNLESRRAAAFTESDLHLLTALAGNLATIIENSRLGEEAKTRAKVLADHNRHLALLNEIAQVAATTLDLPTLYQTLADTLAQIIGGDGCYITQIDETSGEVLGGAAYGPFRDSYRGMRPPPGELTLTESVLKAGRPLVVEDVFHSPYLSPRIAEMFPARSQLGLPLRVGERNLGAVLIAFNKPHAFTEEEVAWATQAVDIAALALDNARLFQGVQQSKRNWEATFDAMPDLIALLDDEYRIVQVNKAMADKLGAPPSEIVGLICYECVHGTQQPPLSCPQSRLLADGQRHSAELHEERLDADFHVSVSPIHDASGQLVGAVHVARDITERKRAQADQEQLIIRLLDALAKVKTLRGLLPICANCKKIRDDKGYWHSVEVYLREHSEAKFSHGICPDCIKELYPWFEEGEQQE